LTAVAAASIFAGAFSAQSSAQAESTSAASPVSPLRACADPDNLPFSSAAPGPKGLYVELAERLGEALGRPVETLWYRTEFAKRAVRNTLLAGQCDLFVGLPADDFMSRRLAMSKPFATLRYALVADARTRARTPEDLLGRRVAVQLATPPQSMLAAIDGVEPITVRTADEGMQALADGRADAAYLWGPSAGYLNRTVYGERFRVQATDGKDLAWPVAVAFRRDDNPLREEVQRELDRLAPWIAQAEARYGFPEQGTAVGPASAEATAAPPILVAQATTAADASGAAPAATASSTERGRDLFNTNCSHCHGPDAASPDTRIDLRRLARRYHEDKDTVFNETVTKGRPDKGMPAWGNVLPQGDISQIKTFIDSVQAK
jgi:ABC-type amino acid transport substrate-binding protein/cytochrome c5